MAYIFFASYSSLDNQPVTNAPEGLLWNVVKELRERVRAKRGDPDAEAIGFFAQSSIQTSSEWQKVLGTTLCSARVIVCLCSPSFFRSEWCAREFDVFRQRLAAGGPALDAARIVIPVVWEPMRGANKTPAALDRFQFKDNRFPADYAKAGLYNLSRLPSKFEDYFTTVDALADTIVDAIAAAPPLPTLATLPALDAIARSFHNPGTAPDAYGVVVSFLHDDGPNWKPAGGDLTAAQIVDDVCAALRVNWRELPAPVDLKGDLEKQSRDRQAVVLLTDSDAATKPRWKVLVDQADDLPADRAAVLVGCPVPTHATAPAVTPEATLAALLPKRATSASFDRAFALSTADVLKTEFEKAVVGMRLKLIADDPPKQKVENAELEQGAKDRGYSVATPPPVDGPGGAR